LNKILRTLNKIHLNIPSLEQDHQLCCWLEQDQYCGGRAASMTVAKPGRRARATSVFNLARAGGGVTTPSALNTLLVGGTPPARCPPMCAELYRRQCVAEW